jgi:phosphatidylglycerol:prolipoprotein diacylglycerol transferase
MFPVLFELGPVIVFSLWLFVGLGFIAGVVVFTKLAKMKRLNLNFIYKYSLSIFIFGLIGARLLYVAMNYQFYFYETNINSFLRILYIWEDKGLSLLGALIGITVSLIYFSYKEKEQTLKWLDILSISVISGLAVGHIGAFLDGINYGRETSLPWGIIFDNPSVKYAVPIHPTQIYAFIYSIIIAVALFFLYKKNKFKAGIIMMIALISYSAMMFLEGFIRGDDVITFLSLRIEQWFALLIIILTGGIFIYIYNKKRKTNTNNTKNGNSELSV